MSNSFFFPYDTYIWNTKLLYYENKRLNLTFTLFDPLNVYIQFRFTKACVIYSTYTILYRQI